MFWTRWSPWSNGQRSGLQQLHEEMNRLFDRWGGRNFQTFPALNVWEDGDALVVEAELPGLALDDLEIFVTGRNQLTIKGERKFPRTPRALCTGRSVASVNSCGR